MSLNLIENEQRVQDNVEIDQQRRSQIRQELQQQIDAMLQTVKDLPSDQLISEIKNRLSDIQTYCKTVGKTFIVVEETITCNQHNLGGCSTDQAMLFRGPKEDASVAICVTHNGSLLHRSSCPWTIYKNAGDVNP